MKSECERIKDKIADYISGILADEEAASLQRHLKDCRTCSEYARALKEEDKLLTALFAEIDTNMEARQQLVLNEINRSGQIEQIKTIPIWVRIMKNRITKLAAAAVIIIAGLIGINYLGGSIDGTSVAWADVVQKFQSIAFFNATIYLKENASKEPMQIEIWRNSEQKTRIRVDGQVLFADSGKIIAGYDFRQKRKLSEEEFHENGLMIAKKLLGEPEFSLNTVVDSVSSGRLEETTPLINPNATISEDMLVFDIQSKISPEWMRIWALCESRLPTRIRMWDPRDGECVDVFITYSTEQSAEFFDPDKYENLLLESLNTTRGGRANLAYAFLKDPGGRDYVPKELFEKSGGYHMPKIEQVGITEYGAVWVVASKSRNQRPDGNTFTGFSKVTDDLDRNYSRIASIWRIDDISVQVFVPEKYPFDTNMPNTITLQCSVDTWHPDEPEEVVGTINIDQWEQGSIWPQERLKKTEADIMLSQGWALAGKQKYDDCQQIIMSVQKLNSDGEYTHDINRLQLNMLISQKKFSEADELAEELLPAQIDIFIKDGPNASIHPFSDYIIAIAANGRTDRATEVLNKLKSVRPDYSKYNKLQQKRFLDRLIEQFQSDLGNALVRGLFRAGLDIESVNQIVGFDVLENDDTKWYVPQEYRMATDPGTILWDNHLEELAAYYKANPLEPGQMELRERPKCNHISRFEIPGLDDYRVMPIGGTLHDFASLYKYPESAGRIKIDTQIDNVDLQHEIISRGQIIPGNRTEFVLAQFGLEVVEGQDICTVWIAEYNSKPLKDFKEVRCPVLRGPTTTPGTVSMRAGTGFNIDSIFSELSRNQDIIVEDHTGIDKNTRLALEIPNFKTEKGAELAEKWYSEHFGITFRKEQRRMPVWIIRKAQ